MKPLKGVLTVLLIILLAAFAVCIQETNRVKAKQIVYVSDTIVDTTTTRCNGFQFMTKDTVFCYLDYSHKANEVEVWGAVRSVICSHKSADLKEPDACRMIQEEIMESHDLEVTIHKIRF